MRNTHLENATHRCARTARQTLRFAFCILRPVEPALAQLSHHMSEQRRRSRFGGEVVRFQNLRLRWVLFAR
jgi:hypothetical protein